MNWCLLPHPGSGAYGQNGAHAQPSGAASGAANGDQLLQEAMQADARGATRKNAKDPFAALGVNFVEVWVPKYLLTLFLVGSAPCMLA